MSSFDELGFKMKDLYTKTFLMQCKIINVEILSDIRTKFFRNSGGYKHLTKLANFQVI